MNERNLLNVLLDQVRMLEYETPSNSIIRLEKLNESRKYHDLEQVEETLNANDIFSIEQLEVNLRVGSVTRGSLQNVITRYFEFKEKYHDHELKNLRFKWNSFSFDLVTVEDVLKVYYSYISEILEDIHRQEDES